MLVAFASQMKEIDKRAIEEYKIPGIVLMENAAMAVYRYVQNTRAEKILVVCGTGNNGGDGFAVSRLLAVNGYEVSVYCFGDINRISGDARVNFDILRRMGIEVNNDIRQFILELKCFDMVIDAVFGTGFKGEVKGIYKNIIEYINKYGKYILSIDMPSGIDSDTGKGGEVYIKANETITFGCMKYGHLLLDGRDASGNVHVENISIPDSCIKSQNINSYTNYDEYPLCMIKKRRTDSNKGSYGRVYIIGGSCGMSGAAALCAKSALRTGSGLVTCVIPESILNRVGSLVPEATYMICSEINGHINIMQKQMDEIMEKADAIACGVGLGRETYLTEQLIYMIKNSTKPMVIDADGINLLCSIKEVIKHSKGKIIITPHPGEMARLTGYSTDFINQNRIEVSKEFAKEYNCIVVLKGASTIVSDGNKTYINTSGNPGMATGGSGDVLTGIIASLIGQGYETYDASVLGVNIHGLAGDDAYEDYGFGLTSMDIIDFIGKYMKK